VNTKIQKITLLRLFSMSPYAMGGTFVMALAVGFVFYGDVPNYILFMGFAMHMSVLVYRAAICKSFSRNRETITEKETIERYQTLYTIGTFLSGSVWGMSVVLLLFQHSIEHQFFIYTVVVGLAGASIVTLSAVFQVYISFVLPMLSISALYALLQEGDIYKATAAFVAGLSAFFYISGKNYYHNLIESIRDKENLISTQNEIVRRLSKAGEYRDNETGMHIVRMSKMCSMLAKECGFNEEYVDNILNASEMHDVGKIGIPDSILLKPAKLTEQERVIMQRHATIGKQILENSTSPLIKLSESIAYTHHEKYDGSGYPNGLEGKNIPIEGRITAICDVFDALVSERPYKKAWSHAEALGYLRKESGKHFDPELVEKFLVIYPQIKEFYAIYHE
jgi:putative two-component system response regulator